MASRVWQSVRRDGSENYSWNSLVVGSWGPAAGVGLTGQKGARVRLAGANKKGRTTGQEEADGRWSDSPDDE